MSVFELASMQEPSSSGERTPPQDIAAEASVLGAMLLSKDAISDAVEIVRSQDFYRPAHQLIYDAILEHYVHDSPADAVTIAAELTRRGELGKSAVLRICIRWSQVCRQPPTLTITRALFANVQ